MRRLFLTLALTALAVAPARAADPPKDFFFQPNDRVVFLGDSITEQYQYSSDIELYLTTRFPKANIVFLNAGIGGDTANGGANRFQSHVLAEKPTAVTINFGMNDGGYGGFNPAGNKTYVEKTAAMLDMAKKAGARVALISPNAVDTRPRPNLATYVETQKRFYAPLRDLAETRGVPFVDQYAVTRSALEAMTSADPKGQKVSPFPDGVHTSGQGGLLMAHAILSGLKAPAVVSDVAVDAKAGKADAKNAAVSDVAATDGGVSFTRLDEALPVPVQKDWLPMLPYTNDLKDLNWYGLTVTGLADGKYAVSVDGKEVAAYTAKELAAGVNLGLLTGGPVWDQGKQVFDAINKKNQAVHARFRGVVMFQFQQTPDWLGDLGEKIKEKRQSELAKRAEAIAAAQADVYKLAAPTPHKFAVTPAK